MNQQFKICRNFVELLLEKAANQPDLLAIRSLADNFDTPPLISYKQLDQKARSVAAHLQTLCVPGDRAIVLLPSGIDYVTAFFGCLYAGLIAVPACPPESRKIGHLQRLIGILQNAAPRVILTTSRIAESLDVLSARFPELTSLEIVLVDKLDLEATAKWHMPLIDDNQIAFLQYTSGSTSSPKGVRISHGNLIANEIAIGQAFGFDENDSVVSWLPLYHDMGLIGGLLQPLFSGISVTLMSPRQFLERPVRWLDTIARYQATVSGGPDFAFRLCAERIAPASVQELTLRSWRLAFCGAEPVRSETIRHFVERFKGIGFNLKSFYPCFGLAEATLLVTGGDKGSGIKSLNIDTDALGKNAVRLNDEGTPIVGCGHARDEHKILIIDPQANEWTETAGIGEIWVSGPSISHGYWNNAEATADSFVTYKGRIFLRTGDLGFLHDGDLFVTGRLKDLIIIRGQNVYPSDIEHIVEVEVDALRSGRVAAFSVDLEGQQGIGLAAEVSRSLQKVINSDALIQAISLAIADVYQEHPSLVLLLNPGSLPKTSSGKLQRALCEFAWRQGALDVFAVYEAGRGTSASIEDTRTLPEASTEVRQVIAEIWQAVLQIDTVAPGDNFFVNGGNSISAARVVARVRDRLGFNVDFRILFENPLLETFACEVGHLRSRHKFENDKSIPRVARGGDLALSHAQGRLWFLWHLEPSSAAYNIAGAVRLKGGLDESALEQAFAALVERHEALRTTFAQAPDGSGLQIIDPASSLVVARADLSALDDATRDAEVRRLAQVESETPFDLETGPLLRVSLVKCSAQDHVLLVTMHHIVSDGWSMQIVVDEFAQLYAAYAQGREPELPELPIQYADYAIWQRAWLEAGESERQLAYWKEQLGAEHPVLELPADRPRPATQSYRGAVHSFEAGADLTRRLRALAQESNVTLFMLLLAAFKTLLYRYTGQTDLRVGVPAANRTRGETEGLIGFFINTQVLRTRIDGRQSFLELLQRMRETALGAQAHQDLPFEQLVEALQPERSLSHQPLFQVMLNHQRNDQIRALRQLPGLEIEAVAQNQQTTKFDLMLDVVERAEGMSFAFTYASDLFEPSTITRLAVHWRNLLDAIAADPARPLGDLDLLAEAERGQILDVWSRGDDAPVGSSCLHELIEARVKEQPNAVAVVYEDASLTYGELNARANQLARHLRSLGVGPDVLVGLAVERSLEMVVGLLAILKAGGAYVPLDPSYPKERLAFMIEDAGLGLVLTQQHLLAELSWRGQGQGPAVEDSSPISTKRDGLEAATTPGPTLFCLDRDWPAAAAQPDADLRNLADPQNLAYCIYTSGSTGKPKGAGNSHTALMNRLQWMQEEYGINPFDHVLQKTPISFDVSVWELFWPLLEGAVLVVARQVPIKIPHG